MYVLLDAAMEFEEEQNYVMTGPQMHLDVTALVVVLLLALSVLEEVLSLLTFVIQFVEISN